MALHLAAASTAKLIRVSVSIAKPRSKPPSMRNSNGIEMIANSTATAPPQSRATFLRGLAPTLQAWNALRRRRQATDPDPVLGDPLLPRRKNRQADPQRSGGTRTNVSVARRGSQRHSADRAE